MADCGLPLPCENTIESDSDALTITNTGGGAAIAATGTTTALTVESANGVGALARSTNGDAILAVSTNQHGVRALSNSTHAVYALSVGASGFAPPASGIFGESRTGPGVAGGSASNVGVTGSGDTGSGVHGLSRANVGVIGDSMGEGFAAFGVVGNCNPGTGVFGFSDSSRGVQGAVNTGLGVVGTVLDGDGTGVFGTTTSGTGVEGDSSGGLISAGVFGTSSGGFISAGVMALNSKDGIGFGLYARGSGGGAAGFLDGDVEVTGSLTKAGGGFKIDHPVERGHKYLSHSFVESPERKNVYDGVVALDHNGTCWVELPGWFEALNGDFRYQLTPIGAPAPNLHVAREISNNRFNIAGGRSGMKVSWHVTGIRKDAWALANPLIVEQEKPESERGYYQHPELHNQPRENSTFWKGNTELMRELDERRRAGIEGHRVREQVRHLSEELRTHREKQQGSSST